MSNAKNYSEARYPDELPAFTPFGQHHTAQAAKRNPAYKPPQRRPPRTNIYDISNLNNEEHEFRLKKITHALTVPSTPRSLSQTRSPSDSKMQARKNSRPLQVKNTKRFPIDAVSKPDFWHHRSNSSGSKASPNASFSVSPATAHTTTMQSGIPMTTMQKLAAFRYQPRSIGSVHKAVAPITTAQSEDLLTRNMGAHSPSAIIFSAEPETHTPDNESYRRNHSKNPAFTGAAGKGNDSRHTSQALVDSYSEADIQNLGFDMVIHQMSAASTHIIEHNGLPFSGSDHSHTEPVALEAPAFKILHATGSPIGGTESRILPGASLDLCDGNHTRDRSGLKFDEWNNDYDGGLNSDDFRFVASEDDQQQEYVSTPLDIAAQTTDLPGQEVSNVIDMAHYSDQTTNSAHHEMLEDSVFDDLTTKDWNHMDYVAITDGQNITRTDLVSQIEHERVDDQDEGRKYTPRDSMVYELSRETTAGHFIGDSNPVHSHAQIFNLEMPPSTKNFADFHVKNQRPGQDIKDDFLLSRDLDDHDLEEVEALSSVNRHEIQTTRSRDIPPKMASMPMPAEEDYLAAFGDFVDEDFKDIEVSSVHTRKEKSLLDQRISTRNLSHVVQVPAIQLHAQSTKKNDLNYLFQTLASRTSPLPRALREKFNKDKYPLQEDENAELNGLSTSINHAVQETKEPPSSVLRSEEDMRDMDMYDKTLKYSPVATSCVQEEPERNSGSYRQVHEPLTDPEDWEFLRRPKDPLQSNTAQSLAIHTSVAANNEEHLPGIPHQAECDDCSPLHPFARPPFPTTNVAARSPVTGLSSNMILRTCFRIGEALSQASLCTRNNQDALTELFARVTFSSRESDGKKQNFQFGDIFHNKPPFISGVLEKYASSDLQKMESFELITVDQERRENELGQMVRVLGRVKRVIQGRGYSINIVNIRKTDWEEVRWTQRILNTLGGEKVDP